MVNSDLNGADFISSFSPGATHFAFQANRSQKNSIDIYPLDDITNLQITSSQARRIDYENNDLKVSEIKLLTWCKSSNFPSKRESKRVKRRNDEEVLNDKVEQFFVNVFPKGKIVVYSSNGKDIINIIPNKKEIIGIDADEDIIWILDDDKTVKRFNYTTTKPLQTFHLTDGKTEEILNFQVLPFIDKILLAIITEGFVYIIDPSKKRPTTVSKIENFGTISCNVYDKEKVVIADISKVSLVSVKNKEVLQFWNVESQKVKILKDKIVVLNISGEINVFASSSKEPVSRIRVQNSEILDFEFNDDSIVVAWIDVNEPRFEVITDEQLDKNNELVFNRENSVKQASLIPDEITAKDEPTETKKASKKEQSELVRSLLEAFSNSSSSEKKIIDILQKNAWSEHSIQLFVRDELNEESANKMFEVLAKNISNNTSSCGNASLWLKWLLTLRRSQIKIINSNTNKLTKHLRSSLRISSESFPTLLSIQGKLEMLAGQSLLRQQLSDLKVNEDELQIQDGELEEQEEDAESTLVYANGEADD